MFLLETPRLILRPLRLEDAPAMYDYAKDPEITKYVSWLPHQSIEDSKAFINHVKEVVQTTSNDTFSLGLVLKEQPDKVIGTVGIRTGTHKYEGELAYALGRKYWRRGYMFEAARALINHEIKEMGLQRVYAWCLKENIASKSLMKKLGMKYEGCFRKGTLRRGKLYDVEYYSILDDEWNFQETLKTQQAGEDLEIIYHPQPSEEDRGALTHGLNDYARETKGMDAGEPFGFFIKNEEGKVLAGCNGIILFGSLYTDQLWVSEELRGKGIGTRMLQAAEDLARAKGCTMTTILTMDWEALDLYERFGYQVDLVREGYTQGSKAFFLKKMLTV